MKKKTKSMTASERVAKWRKKLLADNRCITCGKKKGRKYSHRCPPCQTKFRTYLRKWRAAKKAEKNGNSKVR